MTELAQIDREQFERGAQISSLANELDSILDNAIQAGMSSEDVARVLMRLAEEMNNKKGTN